MMDITSQKGMATMIKILAINGSYRDDGMTAREQHPKLPEDVRAEIKTLAGRLV